MDYLTYFCVRCGRAAVEIEAVQQACNAPENLIAVSHVIAMRALEKQLRVGLREVNAGAEGSVDGPGALG